MNLRSGKVIIKRSNRASSSSSSNEIIQEDITTKLPDEVLTQILSLLPDADANRMRILSHSWNDKDLWAFLPNLHIVVPVCQSEIQENKFHDAVDRILARRGNLPIQKFFLDCSKKFDIMRVYNWLCSVVKCKVQELELRFSDDRYNYRVSFCSCFKACDTLVVLTLKGEFTLYVPEAEIHFPCLKKLNLISVVCLGTQLTNLISGCPVLEELFVDRKLKRYKLESFDVSSHTLKRLCIAFPTYSLFWRYKSVIDAPILEYLHLVDYICTFTKPESLVEAHIDSFQFDAQFFTQLSSSKILTLTYRTMMNLEGLNYSRLLIVPVFHNLIKLETCVGSHWNLLLTLLNNMPNVEHITLGGLLSKQMTIRWNPPVEVPACLSFKMKEIILLNKEAIRDEESIFIRFLLENSNNLETFRVNAHDIRPRMREKLLNIHRRSNVCKFEFV